MLVDTKVHGGARLVALDAISAVEWEAAGLLRKGRLVVRVLGVPTPYVFAFRRSRSEAFEAVRAAIQAAGR